MHNARSGAISLRIHTGFGLNDRISVTKICELVRERVKIFIVNIS